MKKKIVFLLYDSRSGSTFFSALLNKYRGISVSHEGPYVTKIIEYAKPLQTEEDLEKLIDFLFESRLMRELGLEKRTILSSLFEMEAPYTKKDIIENIIYLYFDKRDPEARVVVLKQSIYDYIHLATEACPGLSFIHMVRDGRAVLLSKKKSIRLHDEKFSGNLISSANGWRSKMQKMELFNLLNPQSLCTIKYEDLVKQPETTLGKVLDFLNLNDNEKEITKSQHAYANHIGETQQGIHKNVSKPPMISRIRKWEEKLEANEILLYERIAGESLKELGYPLLYSRKHGFETTLRLITSYSKNYIGLIFYKLNNLSLYLKKEPSVVDFMKRRFNRLKFKLKNRAKLREEENRSEDNRD